MDLLNYQRGASGIAETENMPELAVLPGQAEIVRNAGELRPGLIAAAGQNEEKDDKRGYLFNFHARRGVPYPFQIVITGNVSFQSRVSTPKFSESK